MQIRYKATGLAEHVANEIGRFAIKTGLAVEIPSAVQKPAPDMKWSVALGVFQGDFENPPAICYHCSTCGIQGGMRGPTCHLTQVVRHCGIEERVPKHIADEYVRLRMKHFSRSRRKPSAAAIGTTSPEQDRIRDAAIAKSLGMKPKEVLQEELRQQIAAAGRK